MRKEGRIAMSLSAGRRRRASSVKLLFITIHAGARWRHDDFTPGERRLQALYVGIQPINLVCGLPARSERITYLMRCMIT
jgi:hypothetical protein